METEPLCEVSDFKLTSPRAEQLNQILSALGLNLRAQRGVEDITVQLTTPKGELTLSGAGPTFEGAGALIEMIKLRAAYAFS